uniref:Melanin-concentrating hormone n=1 Tax=Sphyrna lewini TaxID=7823 RepID=K4Q3A9_SPHLE|nr:melanin-concentrating hormone [Sphyrna lewini]
MFISVHSAFFIFVLFSAEFSISSAVGQLEIKVPQNDFNQEMLASISLPEQLKPSGSIKHHQGLQLDKGLDFKMDPKILQHSFLSASQRLFKHPSTLNKPMKEPLYFSAKRTDASQESNQLEQLAMTDVHRVTNDGENGAVLPVGRRDFDMLRCMLGRVYRPCWQN